MNEFLIVVLTLFAGCCSTMAAEPVNEIGLASWYCRASCQREGTGGERVLMANGKPLDDAAMTCALWITGTHGRPLRPDGRIVTVKCPRTGRRIRVAWTDNGPGRRARGRGVVIDLTPAAMKALGGAEGIAAGRVRVEVCERGMR